ncbi:MAG: hypothetical protein ACUVQI_05355, partial [Thermochromatium sp.]
MRRLTVTVVALSAFLPTLTLAQAWAPYGPDAPGAVNPVPYVGHPGGYGPLALPAPPWMPVGEDGRWPAVP